MKLTLKEFSKSSALLPVIVHSIDMAGYQATVIKDGHEYLLISKNGKLLRHQSLMHILAQFIRQAHMNAELIAERKF